jgi:hypothetical protein
MLPRRSILTNVLDLDEYLGDQRWDDLEGVHLNNCWEDPTFLREELHLDLL